MRKIALLLAVVAVAASAQAQVVVGIQGGLHRTTVDNPQYNINIVSRDAQVQYNSVATTWLGGAQVGYMVLPRLYVGVMGGYLSLSSESTLAWDSILIPANAHSGTQGMQLPVTDHRFTSERTGWTVAPIVRFELFKYGNIHFHIMARGDIRSMGYTTTRESYTNSNHVAFGANKGEKELFDPIVDSIASFSWGVSLRPTLTYEFSRHFNAELSLDFLSVGYVAEQEKHDASGTERAYVVKTNTLYGGLNTMMDALRWEGALLRLGFNYTF